MNLQIPDGYVLVPKNTYNKWLKKIEWADIETPTLSDVAEFVGVSRDKIKADMKKIDCPLRIFEKGKKGRGAETKFFKTSAENYKQWIR